MRCVVTGAAGFIGSSLSERLLRDGHEVVGIDSFVPYYPRPFKESNLAGLLGRPGFRFVAADLRTDSVVSHVMEAEAVFHLAAMPGLVRSWTDFDLYASCNLTATERLLNAVREAGQLRKFIYASTSSVYGKYASGDETLPTRPCSPYGVTKLAGELLCRGMAEERGLPLVVLRFFSVYGPRQRPDMAYHRFIDAMLSGQPITVFGDGHQVRGNTYIDDCLDAIIASLEAPVGEIYNLGGGETASMLEILSRLGDIVGAKPVLRFERAREGDQRLTGADTTKLKRHLGWQPRVGLDEGLKRQVDWHHLRQVRAAA
ncbi:MAG: NAD-dependent epimerase/dehydratase family protein [Planctomycetes bacterium]|nr:NAD-dependent epimerase/dehydratase family protein [Planctomycetota bacterium]